MKKFAKILIIQLLLIFLMMTSVNAADEPCKINLTVDKTKVKPGDEITISVIMSNITLEDGIKTLSSVLNLSTDVFDVEFDDSPEGEDLVAQFEDSVGENDEVYPLYIGENDSETEDNDWSALLYITNADAMGIMAYNDELKTQTQTIAKIKLTVNEDVSETQTEVWLDNIEVYGDSEDGTEVEDSNTLKFTIVKDEEETGSGAGDIKAPTNKNTANEKQNKNKNTSTGPANRGAPYTGIEEDLPGFIAIMLLIVSVATYYIYKNEYRNIN